MTQLNQVYKCTLCGNILQVMHASVGTPSCCGKPMTAFAEKTQDAGSEKHVPVIQKTPRGILVKVGSIPHPMEDGHFIEWIELVADGISYRAFLKPGGKPEAEFPIGAPAALSAREYCSLHGLWQSAAR